MVEQKKQENKVEIGGIFFGTYLLFVIFVWFTEVCNLGCAILNVELMQKIVYLVCAGGTLTIFFLLRKRVKFIKWSGDKAVIGGCVIILFIGTLMSVYPDAAYDTYNYHIIAQTPEFKNYFREHFAKGNFQVWGFRLGDHLFYLLRFLLGFRLGTLLNTYVLVISYIQICAFIENNGKGCLRWGGILKPLWALGIVMIHDALLMIGTYYVDILAVPIGFEVLRLLLQSRKQQVKNGEIWYFAILNGLWLAFKMTNVFFVAPIIVAYMLLNNEQINVKRILISGLLVILPSAVYLINNFMVTGNPIFPYMNSIFKSEYFRNVGWKDMNWGPQGILQSLFWIWNYVFRPENRTSEIYSRYNFIIFMGLVFSVLCVLKALWHYRRKDKDILSNEWFILCGLAISTSLLWSFISGYSRYYIWGFMLYGLLAYGLFQFLCEKVKFLGKIIAYIFFSVVAVQFVLTVSNYMGGRNWSWRIWEKETFLEEMSQIFGEKSITVLEQNIDAFYITDSYYTGVADMIAPNTYTYNAAYRQWLDDGGKISNQMEIIENELSSKDIYDIRTRTLDTLPQYVENLEGYGKYVTDVINCSIEAGRFLLFKVEDKNKQNELKFSDEDVFIEAKQSSDNGEISFICGRIYDWSGSMACEVVVNRISDGLREEVYRSAVDNAYVEKHTCELFDLKKGDLFEIVFVINDGNRLDDNLNKAFVLNASLEYNKNVQYHN